jgi:hypothetical protein
MACIVVVLPVPVLPVIRPCRLAFASGIEITLPAFEIPISIEVIFGSFDSKKSYQKSPLKALTFSAFLPTRRGVPGGQNSL